MDRPGKKCHRDYFPAARSSGTRPWSAVKYVVLHDTEGGTADSIAAYFHGSNARGSAHIVVDDKKCQRCLADITIPWGAPGFNSTGFHIEQCGYASWSRARWLMHQPMLHRAAYKAAAACKRFHIPPVIVDADGLRKGLHGVTTHGACTASGMSPGGTHTDPGAGYPLYYVGMLIRAYYKVMKG